MFFVLGVPKKHVSRLVVCQGLACLGQHGHAALHGRSRGDAVEPLLQVRVICPVNALVLPASQPRENRDVSDRVLSTCDELVLGQLLVHHAIEALGFLGVPVHRVVDLFRRVEAEVMRLSQHGTYAAHLEHQPLQHFEFLSIGLRQEFARLRGQIKQDGARLEQADGLAIWSVGIDQRRDLVVGTDLQEFRRELLALADVDDCSNW